MKYAVLFNARGRIPNQTSKHGFVLMWEGFFRVMGGVEKSTFARLMIRNERYSPALPDVRTIFKP